MMLVNDLEDAGLAAKIEPASNASRAEMLVISLSARPLRFALTRRLRAPYPSEIPQLDHTKVALSRKGAPLLIAPAISRPVGRLLTGRGWSWADECGSYDLRHGSVILRQAVIGTLPLSRPREGIPQGRGSLAMVRHLLAAVRVSESITATALGKLAGTSQAAASQLLAALEKSQAVQRQGRSAWLPMREQLLDQFLATYSGPRGQEQHFYTLDGLHEAATAVVALAKRGNVAAAVSADLGPDALTPWRVPTMAVIYTAAPLAVGALKLVSAESRSNANIIIRQPHDVSVFVGTNTSASTLPLTDVPQMLWDLHNLGGSDREEAADKLRQWFLRR